jgi:hypothetical protein
MRMRTTPKIIAVAAAAVGAAGMLTVPISASAAPACLDWRFAGDALFLDLDNGVNIGVPWLGGTNKVRVTQGASILRSPDGGVWQGDIDPGGGTYQGDTIKFRINWTQGVGAQHPMNAFNGKIDPNTGVASGTTVNENNVTNTWTAQGNFTCTARAAEPAGPKPADPGNPPVENTSTITDNVDLYEAPGGVGDPVAFVPALRKVKVLTRQADNWVQISGTGVPNHDTGWVWGDFVKP